MDGCHIPQLHVREPALRPYVPRMALHSGSFREVHSETKTAQRRPTKRHHGEFDTLVVCHLLRCGTELSQALERAISFDIAVPRPWRAVLCSANASSMFNVDVYVL